jgi:hypothetical protein
MSITMDEEIKRWTARRKSALVVEIIQGKKTVPRRVVLLICRRRRSSPGSRTASAGWRMPCGPSPRTCASSTSAS